MFDGGITPKSAVARIVVQHTTTALIGGIGWASTLVHDRLLNEMLAPAPERPPELAAAR